MATAMVIDPVCGMSLDAASAQHSSQHEGRTLYFCSVRCKSAFDANPQQYLTQAAAAAPEPDEGHESHGGHASMHLPGEPADTVFDRSIAGLPEALSSAVIDLRDGQDFELRAAPVRKRLGDATVKMLGYNGSIPGPTFRVPQMAKVRVNFRNEMDLETTVHWHGLRHDYQFDGVPTAHRGMQDPVPQGGNFMYSLRFPDAGFFWYHPHIREDYGQEHGLSGGIIVVPTDPTYWAPVNRELSLVLDDILMEDGQIASFSTSGSDRTAMGRFGNVMLVNGETEFHMDALTGEVVRLYLTNAANTRIFNVRVPGAGLKLVGADNGRIEREMMVDEVLIAPSERAIVDVLFPDSGPLTIEHRTPDATYKLGTVDLRSESLDRSYSAEFETLRQDPELHAMRATLAPHIERAPEKTVALVGVMPGMAHHAGMSDEADVNSTAIEWEDTMEQMNRVSTPQTMQWKLVDRETGRENESIDWSFRLGELVKIRIVNELASDHPMPHPFHIHGVRFLVLSRNGVPNPNLAWKDTVLVTTGETVDILMDASNPGVWMAHCHIAEHLEAGMMFSFEIQQ